MIVDVRLQGDAAMECLACSRAGGLAVAGYRSDFCETHGIDYACVPETGHLLQLEEPERCFALFDDFLASHWTAG